MRRLQRSSCRLQIVSAWRNSLWFLYGLISSVSRKLQLVRHRSSAAPVQPRCSTSCVSMAAFPTNSFISVLLQLPLHSEIFPFLIYWLCIEPRMTWRKAIKKKGKCAPATHYPMCQICCPWLKGAVMQNALASRDKTLLTRHTERRRTRMWLSMLITLCPWPRCQVGCGSEAIYFRQAAGPGHPAGSRPPQLLGLHANHFPSSAISIREELLLMLIKVFHRVQTRCEHLAYGCFLKLGTILYFTYIYVHTYVLILPAIHSQAESAPAGDGRHVEFAAEIR